SAALSRRWGLVAEGPRRLATRFAYALVPLGFAMWFAHYLFHFITSYESAIPTTQRFAADVLGITSLGKPTWSLACCGPVVEWLPHLEILALDLGLLLALHTGYRIALGLTPRPSLAVKVFAPWAILSLALFAAGVWIVLQPMQMRGTLPAMG
ncbi:FesM, partial [Singulisphaera rosea]